MAKGSKKISTGKVGRPRKVIESKAIAPVMVGGKSSEASCRSGSTTTRFNKAGSITRLGQYANIAEGMIPFQSVGNIGESYITLNDVIILVQKAYFNIAIVRNTIETMTELAGSKVYFEGGNAKSRAFFQSWAEKINLSGLISKFFREYFRSGNVFMYILEGNFSPAELKDFYTLYSTAASNIKIPLRYVILNPAQIKTPNSSSFLESKYFKVLSAFEISALKSKKTSEDKKIWNSLDPETKGMIEKGGVSEILMLLPPEKVYTVFYKKQDYEPLAVPFVFPALDDIDKKLELKKLDMALSRSVEHAILLITMGAEPTKGGVNPEHIKIFQELLANNAVGRAIVADYTTKGEWLVPDLMKILDPKKYEILNQDIREALGSLIFDDAKFANGFIKTRIFVEKLEESRNCFLGEFLTKEIKRISQTLGFKSYPTAKFASINLKDEAELARVTTRLIELGALTVAEGFEMLDSGKLPTEEESIENQKKFKALKDQDLYEPLVGGNKAAQEGGAGGRPNGAKAPQTTKKVGPIGGSFSLTKLVDNVQKSNVVFASAEEVLKKKFKIKKLNDQQKEVVLTLVKYVCANFDEKDWEEKAKEVAKNPAGIKFSLDGKVLDIAAKYQVSDWLAVLLSKSEKGENELIDNQT